MPQKKVMSKSQSNNKGGSKMADDSKTFAFLAIFLGLVGFIIALVTKKDDKYVMFYAKQSLALIIVAVGLYIIGFVLSIVTLGIGFFFLFPIIWLIIAVLWFIGWLNALSGQEKYIPVIGKLGDKFNF